MKVSRILMVSGVSGVMAIVLAACGTTPGNPMATASQKAVTVTEAPVTVTESFVTVTRTVSPDATTPIAPASASDAPLGKVPMPNVVGMNLQVAQDKIQTLGIFYSRSEDATGAGRAQMLDMNWIVVRQSPQPGVLIGEGDSLLYVKKVDE